MIALKQKWISRPGVLLLLVCVIGLLWVSGGWLSATKAQNAAPAKSEKSPASQKSRLFYTASKEDINDTILITGELRAERSRDLTVPRIQSGFASTVTFLALEGTKVKQGERILEFDGSTLLSQKSEAERKLDEAKLKIAKTKADLEAQRADLLNELAQAEGNHKVAQLYGKIGKELLPANQYQKYQLDLEKANLALDKAKERLANHEASIAAQLALVDIEKAQAEIELKKINGDLALLSVDSPQDGIIVYGDNWANNRKIQVGDTLFPGMPIVSIPDLSSLQVIGYVYDTEIQFLSPAMITNLTLDALPGRSWRGKIISLTSVASRKGFASQHKVFRAVIQPDTLDLSVMKPGMTVCVEVPVSRASATLAIPRECLGVDSDGRYYVNKGTDPANGAIQSVTVGVFSDRLVQILNGLNPGETVLAQRSAVEGKP
jgi:multidrug efflux pump subunit AcrA (membrane-fusion protein)